MTHAERLEREFKIFQTSLKVTPPKLCKFKVGDEVTFTNEYGIEFPDMTVIGFADDDSFYGRFIHLDQGAYWFPVKPEELKWTNPSCRQWLTIIKIRFMQWVSNLWQSKQK